MPNYIQYFCSNNAEGVAESWLEGEISWVEVDRAVIIFKTVWDISIFYQIFLSSKVKRCVIITYKHSIYELHRDLLKGLILIDLSTFIEFC